MPSQSCLLAHTKMIILSAIFVLLLAAVQKEVQGALNPLIPKSFTRKSHALKCAQLVSLEGGFIFYPGPGRAFPIPGSKEGLLIPGCLEIVYDLKEGKVVRAFEDLKPANVKPADLGPADIEPADLEPADLGPINRGNFDNSQTNDKIPESTSKIPNS